ncbi:deoxyribonuclease IV [Anaerocolumna sp. MB42-C2]|uniref:deoxyribonuclease IV n=1 Tax=Anaerocolumna sp. MB42-C2 TaxID=3070997 RepID=UPI0027E04789|nr:deoxyribonuclease IV [Anaerocolumna sp. MB42-C2]WMJ85990.1 deoxyribonuclease IV [Anaerocolumna sp. MB42-C2]
MLKIGSHVGMSGKEMLLGSAKEADSYGANTFMIYTGAPQNTRRKKIEDLNINAGLEYMKNHGISDIIIHAPYIINLGNSVKEDTFSLATEFLALELKRAEALKSQCMVLHPGAHVGEGEEVGTAQIIKGINEVLDKDTKVNIALETMAGKGSEVGKSFEEIARIYDGVKYNDKLRVCFDTCHTFDSGYDIVQNFDGVIEEFDKLIGKEQIAVFHINDSKNILGSRKDRHENIGMGNIGFDALNYIVHHKDFEEIPKILETPYVTHPNNKKKSFPPYKLEISMFKNRAYNPNLITDILDTYR